MRLIGAAERGMELMAQRALSRKTFGVFIAQHGSFVSDLAKVNNYCVLLSLQRVLYDCLYYDTVASRAGRNQIVSSRSC